MKKVVIGIVALVIIVGGGFALAHHSSKNDAASKPATSTAAKAQSGASRATATSFTINANDETADVKTLNVKKGDTITVTFKVDTDNVYHGGLQFQSDVVSSKAIKPGDSDTVTFTADKSFDFTPYWYQSQVKKDYLIAVNVQS